jgi:hypothetical protein
VLSSRITPAARIKERRRKGRRLEFFVSTFYGFFFGFALGVGCSLVVLYAIYSGGYRKALEDSLRESKSVQYVTRLAQARKKIATEEAGANKGQEQ